MNYWMLFFVLFLIILFTFLFRRIRNPLTNLHIYYKDCTMDSNSYKIINEIFTKINLINYYTIYVFKTNTIPKMTKSYSFYSYIVEADGYNYIILVSMRYKMLSLIDTHDNMFMGIKDGIISLPILPSLWGYHRFYLVINKLSDLIPTNITVSNPIIIHDGVIVEDDLEILYVDFETMKNYTFKCYVIKFKD